MGFDPETLEKEVTYDFRIKVKGCHLCPFSSENVDQTGDYVGNTCNILNRASKFPDCFEVPDYCFLRRKDSNIKVSIK